MASTLTIAGLIVVAGGVFGASAVLTGVHSAVDQVQAAGDQVDTRILKKERDDLVITDASSFTDLGLIFVALTVNNTGDVTHHFPDVEILVNGRIHDFNPITDDRDVDGVATDVWAPGQDLNLELLRLDLVAPGSFSSAKVVTSLGTPAYWRN